MLADRRPLRIAHAYGNSRESLRRALAAPLDMIELDIWYRGHDIVVHHERPLRPLPLLVDKRTRGRPPGAFSLPFWGRYYLRPDIQRLRLSEVLGTVAGSRALLLDVKGRYTGARLQTFAETLAGIVRDHRAEEWVAVCGQNYEALDRLRAVAPEIEVRYSMEQPQHWQRFQEMVTGATPARRICIEHTFLDEAKVLFIRRHEVHFYCWTVDEAAEAERLLAAGAHGIISNDLSLLASLGSGRPVGS